MSHIQRIAGWLGLAVLVASGGGIIAPGCGGGSVSREAARDQATTATCARFNQCGDVGTGKLYPDLPNCQLTWSAKWDNAWPAADCEGKIDQAQLSTCFSAIAGTSCMSFFDFLATLGKCGKANVCDATSSSDGGGG